jgi:hypothetical protein
MDPVSPAAVGYASTASPATIQGAGAVSVLKAAVQQQAASAAQRVQALPQPGLVSSGFLGTLLDAWA